MECVAEVYAIRLLLPPATISSGKQRNCGRHLGAGSCPSSSPLFSSSSNSPEHKQGWWNLLRSLPQRNRYDQALGRSTSVGGPPKQTVTSQQTHVLTERVVTHPMLLLLRLYLLVVAEGMRPFFTIILPSCHFPAGRSAPHTRQT